MKPNSLIFTLSAFFIFTSLFSQNIDYGQTKGQVEFLNVDCLHEKGFTGKGVTIAHFDDGFDGFDKMEAFAYARDKGLLKGNYDFCFDTPIKYADNGSHGTNTLSVVNGYIPGKYVGMAYDANILLAHTEFGPTETHKEEENWRRAVDWAYENGVDIITSSLQYNNFDEGQGNYDYKKDLDGNTTIIAKAADYAASKGILVVAIQGNFGSSDWYYVATPGDADSVLTVGAAGLDGKKAGFSSFGPSADGQVKPDVMAVGYQTIVVDPDGKIRPGNGTSFAGPGVAGMVACLMQAHPDRSNMEIINAVRQSTDRYLDPDVKGGYGYGIPDACKAHEILSDMDENLAKKGKIEKAAYTFKKGKNKACIKPKTGKKQIESIKLFDDTGLLVQEMFKPKKIKLKSLESGLYIIQMQLKTGETIIENLLK